MVCNGGLETALRRDVQKNRSRKVTREVEAQLCSETAERGGKMNYANHSELIRLKGFTAGGGQLYTYCICDLLHQYRPLAHDQVDSDENGSLYGSGQ